LNVWKLPRFNRRLSLWLLGSDCGFGTWYRSVFLFKTCMQNLVQFRVGLIEFIRLVVNLEVLEFSFEFQVFLCPIHGSRCYFGVVIMRASLYDVITLVCIFGLEFEGLG